MAGDASRTNGTKRGDVGPGRPPVEHQFKPGNPGRPQGIRNKFADRFITDFLADWEKHGIEAIEKVRKDKPDSYLRTAAAILPKQFDVNVDDIDSLSLEEVDARLADLETRAVALASVEARSNRAGVRPSKPDSVH